MLHQCCIMSPPAHPPSCHLACFLMAVLPTVGTRLSRFRKTHLDPLQSLLSSDYGRPRGEIVTWQAIAAASSTSRCLNASAKRSIPRGEFLCQFIERLGVVEQINKSRVSPKFQPRFNQGFPKRKDNSTLCTDIAVEFLDVCFPSNLFQGIVHKKASVLTVFFFSSNFGATDQKKTPPKKMLLFEQCWKIDWFNREVKCLLLSSSLVLVDVHQNILLWISFAAGNRHVLAIRTVVPR